ncbi:MGMT family protein [Enterococcus sp. N342-3-1-2]
MNPFYEEVYALVAKIPYGKVVSYSQISWYLGKMNQARAVGRAMKLSPSDLPAHRVVKADGVLVGASAEDRRAALMAEGILFKPNGRVDMKACSWQIPAADLEQH